MQHDHLITRLRQWAGESAEKELFRFVDGKLRIKMTYTYGEMERRTKELAAHLLGRGGEGLQKGDRVLLVFAPSPSFIVTFLACLRAGLVAVPVYPPDPTRMRQHLFAFSSIAQSSGARVALTHGEYHAAKKLAGARAAFTSVFSSKKRTGDWPELEWISVDAYTVGSAGASAGGPAAAYASLDEWQPEDVAFLQYTSGSTAEPKGVMVTHGSLAHNLDIIVKNLRASPSTVVSSWLPQYHDMGLIGSLCGALYCGGSGGYLSPIDFIRDPTAWIRLTSQIHATHLQTPNFGLKLAARKWVERRGEATFGKPDLSSVQHIFNAAEPVTASAIDTFYRVFGPYGLPKRAMRPGYGLAESTVYVVDGGNRIVRCNLDALESQGRAIVLAERPVVVDGADEAGGWVETPEAAEHVGARTVELVALGAAAHTPDVWIVVVDRKNPKKPRTVKDMTVGEVWVQSASVAAGYWGKREQTAATFKGLLVGGPLRQDQATPDMRFRANQWMVDNAGGGKEEEEEEEEEEEAAGGEAAAAAGGGGPGEAPPPAEAEPQAATPRPVQGPPPAMDRWLCTGDLGFLYKGHLYLTGRSKDLIVLRGRNHYPQDLEGTAEAVSEPGQGPATGVTPGALRPGCSAAFALPRHIAQSAAARLGAAPAPSQSDEADAAEALVLVCEPRRQDMSPAQQQQLFRSINDAISAHHGLSPTLTLFLGHHQAVKTSSGKIARRWNVRELERVANGDPESRWDPRKKAVVAALWSDANAAGEPAAATATNGAAAAAAGGGSGQCQTRQVVANDPQAAAGAEAAAAAAAQRARQAGPRPSGIDPKRGVGEVLLPLLQWQVACLLGVKPDIIPTQRPISQMGMESVDVLQLSGELEQDYGMPAAGEEVIFAPGCTLAWIADHATELRSEERVEPPLTPPPGWEHLAVDRPPPGSAAAAAASGGGGDGDGAGVGRGPDGATAPRGEPPQDDLDRALAQAKARGERKEHGWCLQYCPCCPCCY